MMRTSCSVRPSTASTTALAADARRIDDDVLFAVPLEGGIDGVARRACNVRNDGALLAQDTVDERALARIGLSDNGDAEGVAPLFLPFFEGRDGFVQNVADAARMLGGDTEGLPEAERIKFKEFILRVFVELVDDENDGLTAAAEIVRDVVIGARQPFPAVHEEEDDVGSFDGELRLRGDLLPHDVFAL